MTELTGWLLDVYPNETDLTVWLICVDGRRRRFVQDFAPSLYAAGPNERLRQLWKWLQNQPIPARPSRAERRDVFHGMTSVLQVQVLQPARLDELFRSMVAAFPDLTWYDADISIALRYMAAFDVFPLAHVRVEVENEPSQGSASGSSPLPRSKEAREDLFGSLGVLRAFAVDEQPQPPRILSLTPLDTPWEFDPIPAPLRVLSLEPDCDPAHAEPKSLIISYPRRGTVSPCPNMIRYSLPLDKPTALLVSLRADLRRYDPDVILTQWGDTWLLPLLMKLAESQTSEVSAAQPQQQPQTQTSEVCPTPSLPSEASCKGKSGSDLGRVAGGRVGPRLPLNRDESQPLVQRKEHTYFSYGQIVYRGAQVLLRGRWHLDQHNAMLWHDYGLEGVLEMARVTRQPVQEAARLSPGTGISSMQFITALQSGILIPWHKQQFETPKTALQLMQADMGGMVYQPTVGLHRDVGGIDFVSMYPGIMVRFNISPEVPRQEQTSEVLKDLGGLWRARYHPAHAGAAAQQAPPAQIGPADAQPVRLPPPALPGPGLRPQVAAGDLLWLPGLQERPLWAHRGPRGRHRLRARSPAARQGVRRGHGFRDPAHVRGRSVGAQARLPDPGGFRRPAGRGDRPHRAAHLDGRGIPLGGLPALPGERRCPGAQPLLRRLPGRLDQGARHRGPPA